MNFKCKLDEQKLLKLNSNLICKKKRISALKEAKNRNFNLAIFDDGLQDASIKYNLSIVCFNSQIGIGNGLLLPAGPLRENLENLKNYDVVFLNGDKKNQDLINVLKKYNNNIEILILANYLFLLLMEFFLFLLNKYFLCK